MTSANTELRPAVAHIRLKADGEPFLQGTRCSSCGETFAGERTVCARCTARAGLESIELAQTGHIHTCSVVHRSFPGIKTPFVSAVVALDGGGNVQATVREVATGHAEALLGLPVRLIFDETEQRDAKGAVFLAYHFVPTFPGDTA